MLTITLTITLCLAILCIIYILRLNKNNFSGNHKEIDYYKGKFEQLEDQYQTLQNENLKLKTELSNTQQKQFELQTKIELVEQKKDFLEKEKQEWFLDKENLLKKLSLDLIQTGSKQFAKESENLFQHFQTVLNKVSSLEDDSKKREETVSKIKRALIEPGKAGQTSETTLENILKSSGLRQKINQQEEGDFVLQSSFTNANDKVQRPDAIVYLPNNNYLIIDSKSSSHFLELQDAIENENLEEQKILFGKLKDRMNKHLEDLKSKNYQKTQLDCLANKDSEIPPTVMTVMFLQTDKMLEIIRQADKNFENNCSVAGIPVITPIGLINLLNVSKFSINKEKQDKNIGKLKEELKKLLENISSMFKHAEKLGYSLKKSKESYDNFAGIFNRNILTRIKNMQKLGVGDKQEINNKLQQLNDDIVIEGESEEE